MTHVDLCLLLQGLISEVSVININVNVVVKAEAQIVCVSLACLSACFLSVCSNDRPLTATVP